MMYVQDYNDWMLPNNQIYDSTLWTSVLIRYIGERNWSKHFNCPSDKKPYDHPWWIGNEKLSYGYNNTMGDLYMFMQYPTLSKYKIKKYSKVPPDTAIVTELNESAKGAYMKWDVGDYNAYTSMGFPHVGGDTANVLFIDGHVESISRVQASSWKYPKWAVLQ